MLPKTQILKTAKFFKQRINEHILFGFPEVEFIMLINDINAYSAKLKVEIQESGFRNQAGEIHFFKILKPEIISSLIFLRTRYRIANGYPALGDKSQFKYLKTEFKAIERFLKQHHDYHQYFMLQSIDQDELYFTRNRPADTFKILELPDQPPEFSTGVDYLFAKFIAYEKIRSLLLSAIENKQDIFNTKSKDQRKLKWTGEGVNLIELIYGIYETGQVKHGKASLGELMDFFGRIFDLNLNGYAKRFSDIKRRKILEKTKFLSKMQQLVEKRIEDADAWTIYER